MPTEASIRAATAESIARYGARKVLIAAEDAMQGHHGALARVELVQAACNLPAIMLVQQLALEAMTPAETAQAEAEAVVDLARVGSAPK